MSLVASKNVLPLPIELARELERVQVLEQNGRIVDAQRTCESLLARFPENAVVLHFLGILSLRIQQQPIAIEYFTRALKVNPKQAPSYNYLGVAQCQIGDLEAAIKAYKQALKIDPKLAEVRYNLGIALLQLKRFEEAEKQLQQALSLNFKTAELHYNLGFLLQERSKYQEAINQYKAALALSPSYLKAATNLAELYLKRAAFEDAIATYTHVIKLEPSDLALEQLAIAYSAIKKHQEALDCLLKIENRQEQHYFMMTVAYQELKKFDAAYELVQQALTLYPNNLSFLLMLMWLKKNCCLWEGLEETRQKLVQLLDTDEYLFKYAYYYILGYSFEEELQFAKRVAAYVQDKTTQLRAKCRFAHQRHSAKLRIGYLTANVRNHPNAYIIRDLCPSHDKQNFDVFLYSAGAQDESQIAKDLIASADHFIDLHHLSVEDAAKAIYKDKIDILVDLTGYHQSFPTEILALRPAKIQMGLSGHCSTRGADFIDYIFLDETVVRYEEIKYFYEKIIFMPDTYFITSDKQVPVAVSREALHLPLDAFIFTCMNTAQKYDPQSFKAWMQILQQVPNSILYLLEENSVTTKQLLHYAADYGMENRVRFGALLEKQQHLGRLEQLDLFLDAFDCTAHTTSMDALQVGLPVITYYGQNISARGASSILQAHGVPELITYTIDEYIQKAVFYAQQPQALSELRAKILANRYEYPLFNTAKYVGNLEKAYRMVWDKFVKRGQSDHIYVK